MSDKTPAEGTTISVQRFDLRSHTSQDDKAAQLVDLFPEVRTEGGKIDFDRLRSMLGEAVDVGKERYGMSWPGKSECFKTIQSPSVGTLLPRRNDSVNFDDSDNIIIEGDNLEVLKLLQKSYLSKIKLIYIDPPYNTGNEFIYPDNYSESLQTYLEYTGQVDAEGRRFGTNTEADGRFHSKWMNMMYPRLYLAKNLLRDDGLICVSIDDHEVHALRALLNELFGEENFIATCVWQKRYSRENRGIIGDVHDYLLFFAKNLTAYAPERNLLPLDEKSRAVYKNPNKDPKGPWRGIPMTAQGTRPNQMYKVTTPTGVVHFPPEGRCWSTIEGEYLKLREQGRIWFGTDGNGQPNIIRYLSEVEGLVPWTWWPHEEAGHTDEAKKEIHSFFGKDDAFDTPKPVRLMKRVLQIGTKPSTGDLVLDFFAGSGTLGQAVAELNHDDGGNRRFILVQLPEPTESERTPTISRICIERVRASFKRINDASAAQLQMDDRSNRDHGFRVFSLTQSNFLSWNAAVTHDEGEVQKQLELHTDHIRDNRTSDDILYELLIKSGFPLTTPVEAVALAGKRVYSVAGGALIICLEKELTLELIRAIAQLQPERVVCLDHGFAGNDQLKTNAVQTFKTKGVVSFRTV